jgi:hypothetical protein
VFEKTAIPILDSVIDGYNGCIMAYGQTGTGKTHTILGKRDGLLPKSLQYIFHRNNLKDERFVIDISCLQIYMENLTDLFDYSKKTLQIREKNGSFVVTNSIWVRLNNFEEAMKVIEETENRRKCCSTNMNQFSSRSHAIFIIKVTNIKNLTSSNLFLVDLAGSERIKKSYAQGDRLDEAISINTSLMALSKCIYGISENKWNHIPYRESKLTKILQETLAGNGKTVIVITISPDHPDIEETISSLKFGQRASKIYCTPKICKIEDDYLTNNMFILDDQKKILEEENIQLREQCKKLLRIVETTASKSKKGGNIITEEDTNEISRNLKDLLDEDANDTVSATNARMEQLVEENNFLKGRIDEVELKAFEEMRLTYEEVENNLYNEINEHKMAVKKQKKTITLLKKELAEAKKELEASRGKENAGIDRKASLASLKSKSTVNSEKEPAKDGERLEEINEVFNKYIQAGVTGLVALRSEVFSVLLGSQIGDVNNEIVNKLNLCKEVGLYDSPTKTQSMQAKGSSVLADHTNCNNQLESPAVVGLEYMKRHSQNDSQFEYTCIEDNYQSASDDQKTEASSKLLKVLEALIADIDRRCQGSRISAMREKEATAIITDEFTSVVTPFANHDQFKAVLDELKGNKVSLLKVAINMIVENLIKKQVAFRFTEKKSILLQNQVAFLKEIVFSPELSAVYFEAIRKRRLTERAARQIQKFFKRLKWKRNIKQKPMAGFDWGRVRAAMGKEKLQVLLQEVDAVMEAIAKSIN